MDFHVGEVYSSNQLISIHQNYISKGFKFYNGDVEYTKDSFSRLFIAPKYQVLENVLQEEESKAIKIVAIVPNQETSSVLYFLPVVNGGVSYKRLNKLTVKQLIEVAKKKKISYSNLRKHDLIMAIQSKKKTSKSS